MVLSDTAIRNRLATGSIKISHMNCPYAIEPASVDIWLGNTFAVPDYERIARNGACVSLETKLPYTHYAINMDSHVDKLKNFVLEPKSFVLATTLEYVEIPNDLAARIDGRSSIGRSGLFIQNAGWIDPGFCGEITLELFNALNVPILLTPGRRIGQLIFHSMEGEVENPYNGKYQGQKGATESKIYQDADIKAGDGNECESA